METETTRNINITFINNYQFKKTMKKLSILAVAFAALAFAACGNKNAKNAESADSVVKTFEQEQIEASIKMHVDSLASEIGKLKHMPFMQSDADGTVKLTVGSTVTDNIDVTGLGSAAFEDATAFDPAGTAQAAVEALDGSATIASVSSNVVTIKSGITEVDGVVSNNSGNDVVLEEVAITGAAADVSIADSGNKFTADNVEAALQEVKGIADANASAISGMDADIDASASSSDPNAVSVMSGITEVDGVITSVDSVSVDAAGSATQAEANAKAYVDTALTWGSFS